MWWYVLTAGLAFVVGWLAGVLSLYFFVVWLVMGDFDYFHWRPKNNHHEE